MIEGVQVFCFAACYAVTLTLEVTRLFFRARVRMIFTLGFALAGVVAHSVYLMAEAQHSIASQRDLPLSSWHHWCLLAAWVLVVAYIAMAVARPKNALGIFILPLVFLLIGVAWWFPELQSPFPPRQAYRYWSVAHGGSLLLGTAVVMLGFVAGLMYLVQSYRLKNKQPLRQGLQLPSLEWLQRMNEDSFILSSCLLALGLISGVVLNFIRHSHESGALPWTDPVVWTSAVLFLWLASASVFHLFYRPARQGRKVAYLTVASFVFLGLALGVVLFAPSKHAMTRPAQADVRRTRRNIDASVWRPSLWLEPGVPKGTETGGAA